MLDQYHSEPRLIRKYANRRMYDTHTSTHVNVNDIRQLVIDEIPFQVVDAKSGEDLTRSILLQIIQEAENDGEPIISVRLACAAYVGRLLRAKQRVLIVKKMMT